MFRNSAGRTDHHSGMEWMDGVAGHRTGKFNEPGKQLTSEVRTVRSSFTDFRSDVEADAVVVSVVGLDFCFSLDGVLSLSARFADRGITLTTDAFLPPVASKSDLYLLLKTSLPLQ